MERGTDTGMVQQLEPETIAEALAASPWPDRLKDLLACARAYFGVHWRHFPYTINYPWAAEQLDRVRKPGRILEIGAGANPLPFYLAERGYHVDTVDNADYVRTLPAGDDWNEWGFFDYGAHHPAIRSYNVSVEAFAPAEAYDAIYAVSVIAHMPSPVREATLTLCRQWLKPGGLLVLATDLIPGTDSLWNKGGSGETPEQHGTFGTMELQLQRLGFDIAVSQVQRKVPHSRTDLHFLVACLPPA